MGSLVVENLAKTYPGTRKSPPVEAVKGVSFGFTWEAMYEDVFPAVSFWYLFGRLPGQSGKQAFE